MKKFIAICIMAAAIVTCATFAARGGSESQSYDYLRIHVRANSNAADDQAVKYKVKDEVVAFITPYAAECTDKQRAMEVIGGIIEEIEDVCERTLEAAGYYYGAKAEIRAEKFPTRVYDDVTLEEGIYDALIIELGSGTGDNWWCVIYPPLCFTSSATPVKYRSAIYEIIKKFKANI